MAERSHAFLDAIARAVLGLPPAGDAIDSGLVARASLKVDAFRASEETRMEEVVQSRSGEPVVTEERTRPTPGRGPARS